VTLPKPPSVPASERLLARRRETHKQITLSDALARLASDSQDETAALLRKARELIQAGAITLHADAEGDTALMCAARNGQEELVELLLPLSNPDAQTVTGDTALMMAARAPHENARVFQRLLECSDAKLPNQSGVTALMMAAKAGNAKFVEMALPRSDAKARAGVNLSQANASGQTALILAAEAGSADCVALLLPHSDLSAVRGYPGRNALGAMLSMKAAGAKVRGADYPATLNIMLPWFKDQIEKADGLSESPLEIAAAHGHFECVKILAPLSPNVCAIKEWRDSPCFKAAANQCWEIADWLSDWVPESVAWHLQNIAGPEKMPKLAARMEKMALVKEIRSVDAVGSDKNFPAKRIGGGRL